VKVQFSMALVGCRDFGQVGVRSVYDLFFDEISCCLLEGTRYMNATKWHRVREIDANV